MRKWKNKYAVRTMLYDAPIPHIRQTIRHGVFAIRQLKFEYAPFPAILSMYQMLGMTLAIDDAGKRNTRD